MKKQMFWTLQNIKSINISKENQGKLTSCHFMILVLIEAPKSCLQDVKPGAERAERSDTREASSPAFALQRWQADP